MLKISVKFRAFGITFGTVERSFRLSEILKPIAKAVPVIEKALPMVDAITIPPHVYLDERGFKIEIV